jgi:hypothetical protein
MTTLADISYGGPSYEDMGYGPMDEMDNNRSKQRGVGLDSMVVPKRSDRSTSGSSESSELSRGVHRTSSCIVRMMGDAEGKKRRGSLTFSSASEQLPRAVRRNSELFEGGKAVCRPLRRTNRRASIC